MGLSCLVTIAAAPGSAIARTAQAGYSASFNIFVGEVKLGSETLTVTDTPAGRRISSFGRINAPVDMTTNKFEVTYAPDGQPLQFVVEAIVRGQAVNIGGTFTETTVALVVDQAGQRKSGTQTVSPRTIVLPTNVFGAYEAVAMRLHTAAIGASWPIYVTADAELTATVTAIVPRHLMSPSGALDFRQFDVTFAQPGGPLSTEIWVDRQGHLARLVLPRQGISLVRTDLESVMVREVRASHAGDEDVFIPSSGFSLAGTFTKPSGVTGKLPVVVLVGGMSGEDRDETTAGIPVLGHLAVALADAGYAVVRYDKRGAGQSGGRIENATLTSYANDLQKVVEWLATRKDIDNARIAVAGYDDGGSIALLAAARTKRVRGVALLATPGRRGREAALERQAHELGRMTISDADRAARVTLQTRVLDAAATGKGWELVPTGVRRQSDTPAFRSWVLFDPVTALAKVKQPVLILQGALDRHVPPAHADLLEAAARARKLSAATPTGKVVLEGLNHLFAAASTGEVDEYPRLPVKSVAPQVSAALVAWLETTIAVRK
jgi:uncharacterized protein